MSFDQTPPPAPPQGPAVPPAPSAADAAKPKAPFYKKWWFWVIVVVVAIAVFVPKGGNADDAGEPAANEPAATESEAPAADEPATEEEPAAEEAPTATALGTAAIAGDLEITVTQVETGVAQVGEEIAGTLLGEKAQGQFVLVHLSVKNVTDSPASFSSFNAKLLDDQNREFSANEAASLYIEGNSLFEEINPGNTLQGVIVFDIPADATPSTFEYESGLFAEPASFLLK